MLPTILDFEASGFGYHSYPIEVGVALYDGGRFCTLITPAEEWSHWDTSAERIHNISRDELYLHGQSPKSVCSRLNALLADQTVYSDGWVVDKPWLSKLYQEAAMQPSFDLSPLEAIQCEAQQEIWADTKSEILKNLAFERHRASNDALLIQKTFQETRRLVQVEQNF